MSNHPYLFKKIFYHHFMFTQMTLVGIGKKLALKFH